MDPAGYALERISMAELAVQALAQEYAAARAEIERLKAEYDGMPTYNAVCQQMHETEQELAAACAEIERLKAELDKAKEAHDRQQDAR